MAATRLVSGRQETADVCNAPLCASHGRCSIAAFQAHHCLLPTAPCGLEFGASDSFAKLLSCLSVPLPQRIIDAFQMDQCLIFCRTNFDCDNLEKFLNSLGELARIACLPQARLLAQRLLRRFVCLPAGAQRPLSTGRPTAPTRPPASTLPGGESGGFRGKRESGKENPYSCCVLAGARSMDERRAALEVRFFGCRVVVAVREWMCGGIAGGGTVPGRAAGGAGGAMQQGRDEHGCSLWVGTVF